MISLSLAKRYAKAFLEIAQEDDKLEVYGAELGSVVELFDSSRELEAVLTNPAFDLEGRQRVLGAILDKAGLSHMLNNFLRLLLDRGRMGELRNVATVYDRLTDEAKGITRAQVRTAAPLAEDEQDRLVAALKEMAGREVSIEVTGDPSLIGGVVARIGDVVLDGSVRNQLETLKESLRRGEYV